MHLINTAFPSALPGTVLAHLGGWGWTGQTEDHSYRRDCGCSPPPQSGPARPPRQCPAGWAVTVPSGRLAGAWKQTLS